MTYKSREWTYQHRMSVHQKFQHITSNDLLAVADRFGVRKPASILADVRSAIDSWSQFACQANLSQSLRDRVAADHRLL